MHDRVTFELCFVAGLKLASFRMPPSLMVRYDVVWQIEALLLKEEAQSWASL